MDKVRVGCIRQTGHLEKFVRGQDELFLASTHHRYACCVDIKESYHRRPDAALAPSHPVL